MKKKILVWISLDLNEFCTAYELQKNPDFELYGIVDVPSNAQSFFEKQTLVKFKRIWFFHDNIKKNIVPDMEYLKSIEKKYDIPLWEFSINERTFYRFFDFHKFKKNEILSITEQSCKLFENILEHVNPDCLISKIPGFYHLEILKKMCEKKTIHVFIPFVPKIGYRLMISTDPNTLNSTQQIHESEIKDRSFEDLQKYAQNSKTRKQIKTYTDNIANSKSGLVKAAFKFLFSKNNSEKNRYTYYGRTKIQVILFMLKVVLRDRSRKKFINEHFEKEIKKNHQFIYFPLGVDLERNILIAAPHFTNQIEVIRSIVKALPVGYELWVKENPAQSLRSWRAISDYKEILSIPNVRLFHPDVSNFDLIKNCSMVATVGGSSGLEGALYGKPSIIFSDTLYSELSCVKRVREIENLPEIINSTLKQTVDSHEISKFLQLVEKNSFEFDRLGFNTLQTDTFFYNGSLLDTEINEETMKDFLIKNTKTIQVLGNEFTKQINSKIA